MKLYAYTGLLVFAIICLYVGLYIVIVKTRRKYGKQESGSKQRPKYIIIGGDNRGRSAIAHAVQEYEKHQSIKTDFPGPAYYDESAEITDEQWQSIKDWVQERPGVIVPPPKEWEDQFLGKWDGQEDPDEKDPPDRI